MVFFYIWEHCMVSKLTNIFVGIGLLGVFLYGCLFLHSSVAFPYIFIITILCLVVWMCAIFIKRRWLSRLKTVAGVLFVTYFFLEVFVYTFLSFGLVRTDIGFFSGGFSGSNRPLMNYDKVCGYKMTYGLRRHMSIGNGEFEFDHMTVANEQGWYSKRNYFPKKGNKKRYMVLGDSYSAGLSTPLTWVDIVQDILQASNNDSVELYNFSQEGAGLANWHRIYYNELLHHYEFDGIIFAISSEKTALPDLDRNFIVGNSYNDGTYMTILDLQNDQFVPDKLDKGEAIPFFSTYSDTEMDEIKEEALTGKKPLRYRFKSPDLYFLRTVSLLADVSGVVKRLEKNMSICQAWNAEYQTLAKLPYQESFFFKYHKNVYLLSDIWSDCKKKDKDIIWVTIPDYENALDYVQGKEIIYRKEAEYMSKLYGATWYDGFTLFTDKNEAFVEKSYYKYDKHWNENTVREFSKSLTFTLFNQ